MDYGDLLSDEAGKVVFYILEEALNNARKYAKAGQIEVRLWRENNWFMARVADDGVGFDTEATANSAAPVNLGLVHMYERAERIDGSIKVESEPGSRHDDNPGCSSRQARPGGGRATPLIGRRGTVAASLLFEKSATVSVGFAQPGRLHCISVSGFHSGPITPAAHHPTSVRLPHHWARHLPTPPSSCCSMACTWLAYRQVRRRGAALPLAGYHSDDRPLLPAAPLHFSYQRHRRISLFSARPDQQRSWREPLLGSGCRLGDEPFSPLAGEWVGETSPYGPVWELAAAGAASLVKDNLLGGLLIFKALAALTHLAATVLIWLSLRATEAAERSGHTLLWAWNPALLLIFAVDAHNDGLMLLWLLLGWWIMGRGRPQIGMIIMLLAPLTKPIGLLPLPYFFLASWRRQSGQAAKARFLLITAVSAVILAWLAFLPFGDPLALAERLLSESGTGGGFSPLALLVFWRSRTRAPSGRSAA